MDTEFNAIDVWIAIVIVIDDAEHDDDDDDDDTPSILNSKGFRIDTTLGSTNYR